MSSTIAFLLWLCGLSHVVGDAWLCVHASWPVSCSNYVLENCNRILARNVFHDHLLESREDQQVAFPAARLVGMDHVKLHLALHCESEVGYRQMWHRCGRTAKMKNKRKVKWIRPAERRQQRLLLKRWSCQLTTFTFLGHRTRRLRHKSGKKIEQPATGLPRVHKLLAVESASRAIEQHSSQVRAADVASHGGAAKAFDSGDHARFKTHAARPRLEKFRSSTGLCELPCFRLPLACSSHPRHKNCSKLPIFLFSPRL